MTLRLSEPDPALHASYLAALEELTAEGNAHFLAMVHPPEPGYAGADFTLETLADPATFAEFCAREVALSLPGTPRPTGWVTGTYLWMVDDTPTAAGGGPDLAAARAHRRGCSRSAATSGTPSGRRRGDAGTPPAALALMLPVAAEHGWTGSWSPATWTTWAPARVIEANGGVLEDVRGTKRRYWIPTTPPGRARLARRDRRARRDGQAPGVQTFLATSRPSPTGSSTGSSDVVLADGPAELADRHGLGVALGGVGDPVVPQGVVEGHDAARLEQPQRLGEVLGVLASCRRRRTPGRSGRR